MLLAYIIEMLYPFKPLEVEEPILLRNNTIEQGGHVVYDIHFCKYTDKPATVQRYLADGLDTHISSLIINNPVGCKTATLHLDIPECTPPGMYRILHVATYDYPLGRKVTIRYETEEFEVVEK